MITGIRQTIPSTQRTQALEQIAALKTTFGLKEHYLERLLHE